MFRGNIDKIAPIVGRIPRNVGTIGRIIASIGENIGTIARIVGKMRKWLITKESFMQILFY
jgi:hypothetical protein